MTNAIEPAGPASQGALRSARRLQTGKGRDSAGAFLAEGPQAVREALTAQAVIQLLVSDVTIDKHRDLLEAAARLNVAVLTCSQQQLQSVTDTVTPAGIVAVCRTPQPTLADLGEQPHLIVVGDQVRDPGNLGTVIRCADAFGADAVILTTGSVDPYNPKAVRASVGSIFHLPVIIGIELTAAVDAMHQRGVQVLATSGTAERTLLDVAEKLSLPTAWLFGNEAWGLPASSLAVTDEQVAIPMWGQAESLNLSTAAAVCLYATASAQHRPSPETRSQNQGEVS